MLTSRLFSILDVQAVPAAAPAQGTLHELKDFKAIDQGSENPNWCWAGAAVMVFRHYSDQLLDPCKWATICIGKSPNQCCLDPGSCDSPFAIASALRGMLGGTIGGALDATAIRAQIDMAPKGRPIVCVQIAAAHVVVIYGIDESIPGKTMILSVDPAGGYRYRTEIQEFTTRSDAGWSATALTQPGGP